VHSCGVELRPCPYTACRHHLANGEGEKFARRQDCSESCSLDVAERGGATLETVGKILGLTRERVRQIETRGVRRIGRLLEHAR